MIQAMRYLTITGPIEQTNWAIEHYLSRYEMHLEYAPGFRLLGGDSPYREAAQQAAFFLELLGDTPAVYFPMTGKQALESLEATVQQYEARSLHIKALEQKQSIIKEYLTNMRPFSSLNTELRQIDNMKHINCIFGKIPLNNFLQFETFLYEDAPIIFIETSRDEETVWGCYFGVEVYAMLASYNFEHIPISAEEIPGTVAEIIAYQENELVLIESQIKEKSAESITDKNSLLAACRTILSLNKIFEIKQYAAKTADHYIFVGWMPSHLAQALERETANDENIIVSHYESDKLPPTKLVNFPGIRWFEFFVRLYGLPKYNEIDPTPILAVFYVIFFGMMFGDVGHGLGLALLGWYLLPKYQLGGVMIAAGLSATFFGFLYGSIFGFENAIPALWRHPSQDIAQTLFFATALGAVTILLTFILNMANAFRQRNYQKLFFSPNGVSGLMFYVSTLAAVFGLVHWALALVPLAAIAIKGMAHQEKASLGMTIFQRALGLFEILLAYLTNTVSFVRVGAFALSHAGMMHVVMMLSQGASESRNFIIIIIGNIIVMSIEGLLIGIQSLRLGFYEIFSRFYEGGGDPFEVGFSD